MSTNICPDCGNSIHSYSDGVCYVCVRNERDRKKYYSGRLSTNLKGKKSSMNKKVGNTLEGFKKQDISVGNSKKKNNPVDKEKAIEILKHLAFGIDPFKKEELDPDSFIHDVKVVRALIFAIESLRNFEKKEQSKKIEIIKEENADGKLEDELFETLRKWRLKKCRELGVPAYVVIPNETLREIAREKPIKIELLKGIYGMGKRRIENYGEILCEIVIEELERKRTN